MSIADLNLIFETETEAYYLRQSNKNKYYYKGIKQKNRIAKLQRVNSSEFWEEFNKNKNPVFEDASKKIEAPEKPETLDFEPADKLPKFEDGKPFSEDLEPVEEELEIQEEPKKSFLDRSIF